MIVGRHIGEKCLFVLVLFLLEEQMTVILKTKRIDYVLVVLLLNY